jgi:hypothetical protein
MFVRSIALLGGALIASQAMAASFIVSLESEAPGLQNSTSQFYAKGVETFESRPTGFQNFTSNFGGSDFTGVYTGLQVLGADQYGGAGGTGKYAVTFSSSGYSLDLSTTQPGGVKYFGYWLSALDRGNNVTFYSGNRELFTFSSADAKTFIDGLPNKNQYYGNPNSNFSGRNRGEPYAFLNFYARGNVSFDRIVFTERPQVGGYESDNHTVGRWKTISGTVIATAGGVPEPATWAMLIAGFGMVGLSARRRKAGGRSVAA